MPYANIEEQRKAQREYYYRNKEAVNKKTKEWKEANPKRNAEFKVTWRKNNSEKAKEQNRTP